MLAAAPTRLDVLQSEQAPPKNLSEIKQWIVLRRDVFSKGTERVLRIAIADPGLVAFGTMNSVARACSVSPTTVNRAVHALGFASFRDLRFVFREHIRQTWQ